MGGFNHDELANLVLQVFGCLVAIGICIGIGMEFGIGVMLANFGLFLLGFRLGRIDNGV